MVQFRGNNFHENAGWFNHVRFLFFLGKLILAWWLCRQQCKQFSITLSWTFRCSSQTRQMRSRLCLSMANCHFGLNTVACEVLLPLPGCATSSSCSFM